VQGVAGGALLAVTLLRIRALYETVHGLPRVGLGLSALDGLVNVSVATYLVCLAVAAITWLTWQRSAHANLRALGVAFTRFSPAWAVGWWFVPFANLGKPFAAVRELWKASDPAAGASGWHMARTPRCISWWWFLLLVAVLNTPVPVPWGTPALGPSGLLLRDELSAIAEVAMLVATPLAIRIVRGVTERQEAKAERMMCVPPEQDLMEGAS
jgi:hypothetical protein